MRVEQALEVLLKPHTAHLLYLCGTWMPCSLYKCSLKSHLSYYRYAATIRHRTLSGPELTFTVPTPKYRNLGNVAILVQIVCKKSIPRIVFSYTAPMSIYIPGRRPFVETGAYAAAQ